MKHRLFCGLLSIALASVLTVPAWAQLTPYSQDFEALLESSLDQPDQLALASDGWSFFVNVFPNPDTGVPPYYFYFGPAPNGGFGGPAISAVVAGEGGLEQGAQQLSIFSDYNNGDHAVGALIEVNVFQEQIVDAADVGSTWVFEVDFKRGNIDGATTAAAFIKTLDPAAGFALTNFLTADMTDVPDAWGSTLLSIYIDPSLEGQILQFGFLNTATDFDGSGIFYDNVRFIDAMNVCEEDEGCVTLCHKPGTPAEKTLCLPESAVDGHLGHGDYLGVCGEHVGGDASSQGFKDSVGTVNRHLNVQPR